MFFLRLRDSRAEIRFCSRRSLRLPSLVSSPPPELMEASSAALSDMVLIYFDGSVVSECCFSDTSDVLTSVS